MDYRHTKGRTKTAFLNEISKAKNPILSFTMNPEWNWASCYAYLWEEGNPNYRPIFGGIQIRYTHFGPYADPEKRKKELERFNKQESIYKAKYERWYKEALASKGEKY